MTSIEDTDDAGWTALMFAISEGDSAAVHRLTDLGADVNAADSTGQTVLQLAASCADSDIVDFLIRRGADINAPGWNGESAIVCAVLRKRLDSVRVLLSAGADTRVVTDYACTLHELATKYSTEEIRALLPPREP